MIHEMLREQRHLMTRVSFDAHHFDVQISSESIDSFIRDSRS